MRAYANLKRTATPLDERAASKVYQLIHRRRQPWQENPGDGFAYLIGYGLRASDADLFAPLAEEGVHRADALRAIDLLVDRGEVEWGDVDSRFEFVLFVKGGAK